MTGSLGLACADRGRHPEILLGFSHRHRTFGLNQETRHAEPTGETGERTFEALRAGRVEVVTAPDGHRTVRLRCPHPRCRRDVQWREEVAVAVVEREIVAGRTTLDISGI